MEKPKKRSYIAILIVIISLVLSPLSLGYQDDMSSSSMFSSDNGISLGGFAKIQPLKQSEIFGKSEKTSLMQGPDTPGCCANPYILTTPSAGQYCIDTGTMTLGVCCPYEPPSAYGGPNYPTDQNDCLNNYFNSTGCSALASKCELGCCYKSGSEIPCANRTADACSVYGGDFNAGTCDNYAALCTTGATTTTSIPGPLCNYNNASACDIGGCSWCNGDCIDSCTTSCAPYTYRNDSGYCVVPSGINSHCDPNFENPCCFVPSYYDDTSNPACTFCPESYQAKYNQVECQGNVWDPSTYNYSTAGFAACCNITILPMPICYTGQIKGNQNNLSGFCRCGSSAYDTTNSSEIRYCCGDSLSSTSCMQYNLAVTVKFYNETNAEVTNPEVTATLNLKRDSPTSFTYPPQLASLPPYGYTFSGLSAGQHTLTVTALGYDSNKQQGIDPSSMSSITINMNQTHVLPTMCRIDWPVPTIAVTPIPCNKSVNVSWSYGCNDSFLSDTSAFVISKYKDGALLKSWSINKNAPRSFTEDISSDFEPNKGYYYNITVSGTMFANWTGFTWFSTGPNECYKTDCGKDFCFDNNKQNCSAQNTLNLKMTCSNAKCVMSNGNPYCVANDSDCKSIYVSPASTLPAGKSTPNIFGLYYYDFTDDCFGSGPNTKYCYYDSYSTQETEFAKTPTDVCISCNNVGSCYDYVSESACNGTYKDKCTKALSPQGCQWYSAPENFASLGKGYCYDPAFNGTNFCGLCNASSTDVFRRSGCTPDLCRALGSCFSNADETSCGSCVLGFAEQQPTTTCYNYTDKIACQGSDVYVDPMTQTGKFDSCGLNVCRWLDNEDMCVKDGDSNTTDDCLDSDDTCYKDYARPSSNAALPINFNTQDPIIRFAPTDAYPDNSSITAYYCYELNAGDCDNINQFTALTPTGAGADNLRNFNFNSSLFLGVSQKANFTYFSMDRHYNKEITRRAEIFIDTMPPAVTVSDPAVTDNLDNPSTSDLTLTITAPADEAILCSDSIGAGGYHSSNLSNTIIDADSSITVAYTNLADNMYAYTLNCRDGHGNPADIYLNGQPISNPIPINVDRILMIVDPHPTYNDQEAAIIKQGNNVILSVNISDTVFQPGNFECNGTMDGTSSLAFTAGGKSFTKLLSTSALNNGEHVVNVSCRNILANTFNDSIALNFIVDSQGPTTNLSRGAFVFDNNYNNKIYAPSGTVLSFKCTGNNYSLYGKQNDCATTLSCVGTSPTCPPNTAAPSYTVANNNVTLCFYSLDYSGNQETPTKCKNIIKESSGPNLIVSTQPTTVTNSATIVINGSASDYQSGVDYVAINNEQGNTVILDNPSNGPEYYWSGTITLVDGMNNISIAAYNSGSFFTQKNIFVYKDAYGPNLTSISLVNATGALNPSVFEYYSSINVTANINDAYYTALTEQMNNATLIIDKFDPNSGVPIISPTFPKSFNMNNLTNATTSFNYQIANDADIKVGKYRASINASDRFGNYLLTNGPNFTVNDTVGPSFTIKVFDNSGGQVNVTTKGILYRIDVSSSEPVSGTVGLSMSLNGQYPQIDFVISPNSTYFEFQTNILSADYDNLDSTIFFTATGEDENGAAGIIVDGGYIPFDSKGPNPPVMKRNIIYSTSPGNISISGTASNDTASVQICKVLSNDSTECNASLGIINPIRGNGGTTVSSPGTITVPNLGSIQVNTNQNLMAYSTGYYLAFANAADNPPDGSFYSIIVYSQGGNMYSISLTPPLSQNLSSFTQGVTIYNESAPNGWFKTDFDPSSSGAGFYYFRANGTDALGNLGGLSNATTLVYDPVMFNFVFENPSNGSVTSEKIPTVRVTLNQTNVPININSINLSFNGVQKSFPQFQTFCSSAPDDCQLAYTPSAQLAEGLYNVSVAAKDMLNRTNSYDWKFTINYNVPGAPNVFVDGMVANQSAYTPNSKPTIRVVFNQVNVNLTQLLIVNDTTFNYNLRGDCNESSEPGKSAFNCTLATALPSSGLFRVIVHAKNASDPTAQEYSSSFPFYYDGVDPTVDFIISGEDQGIVLNPNVTLTVSLNDNLAVDYLIVEGDLNISGSRINLTSSQSIPINAMINLGDGNKTVNITLFDKSGRSAKQSESFYLNSPMVIQIVEPQWGEVHEVYQPPVRVNITNKVLDACNLSYDNWPNSIPLTKDGSEFYTGALPAELNHNSPTTSNFMSLTCIKSDGSIHNGTFVIKVDQENPNITNFEVVGSYQPQIIPDPDPNTKHYLINNINENASGSVDIIVNASEPVICNYSLSINGTSQGTVEMNPGNPLADIVTTQNFTEPTSLNIVISCSDRVYLPAISTKTINLDVNHLLSVSMNLVNPTPIGYVNSQTPVFNVTTGTKSKCFAHGANGTYAMNNNSLGTIHTISGPLVVGPLSENQFYDVNFTCMDMRGLPQPYKNASKFITFKTDWTKPSISILHPNSTEKNISMLSLDIINGNVLDNNEVTLTLYKDGSSYGTASLPPDFVKSFNFTSIPLNIGSNVFNLTAVDSAGNINYTNFTVNASLPLVIVMLDEKILGSQATYINSSNPNLKLNFTLMHQGYTYDNINSYYIEPDGGYNGITLSDNSLFGKEGTITGLASNSTPYTLVVGAYVTGPVNSNYNKNFTFYYDDADPTIQLTFIGNNNETNKTAINVKVNATDVMGLDSIVLDGPLDIAGIPIPVPSGSAHSYVQTISFNLTDADDYKTITATAYDKSGRSNSSQITVLLNRPTEIVWTSPATNRTNTEYPTIVVNTPGENNTDCSLGYLNSLSPPSSIFPEMDDFPDESHSVTLTETNKLKSQVNDTVSTQITVSCNDTFGEVWNQQFNLAVDKKLPNIIYFNITRSALQKKSTIDFLNFTILDPQLDNKTKITLNANEPVNCSYQLNVNGNDEGTFPFNNNSYNNTHLSDYIEFQNQDNIYIYINCMDMAGNTIPNLKTIYINVNPDDVVDIYAYSPSGTIKNNKPILSANTTTDALCRADISSVQPSWLAALWALFTTAFQQTGADMNTTNGNYHYLNLSGQMSFPSNLSDGSYTFNITCTDTSGLPLKPGSRIVNFKIDTTPPTLNINNYPLIPVEVNDTYYYVSGNVSDADTEITVNASINGALFNESNGSNRSFGYNMTLRGGSNQIIISAVDSVGNKANKTFNVISNAPIPDISVDNIWLYESNIVKYYIDNPEPTILLQFPTVYDVTINSVRVTGPGGYNNLILDTPTPATLNSNSLPGWEGNLSGMNMTAAGAYNITVNSTRMVGGNPDITAVTYARYYFDKDAPEINITGPSSVANMNATLTVTASDDVNITYLEVSGDISGSPIRVDLNKSSYSNNSFKIVLLGNDGYKQITATAYDNMGHSGSANISILLNRPTNITWVMPASMRTIDPILEMIVTTVGENDSSCTLKHSTNLGYTSPVLMTKDTQDGTLHHFTNTVNLNFTAEKEVSNKIIINCTDAYGNSTSKNFTIIVDQKIPNITSFTLGNAQPMDYNSEYIHYYVLSVAVEHTLHVETSEEPTDCYYNDTIDSVDGSGSEGPYSLGELGVHTHEADVQDKLSNGTNTTFHIWCIDQSGLISHTKTILTEVPGSPVVAVFNTLPTGIVRMNNPTLSVKTIVPARCRIVRNSVEYPMTQYSGKTLHNISATAALNGNTLDDNTDYSFDVVCSDDGSGLTLGDGNGLISFRTKFYGPALEIYEPLECNDDGYLDTSVLSFKVMGNITDDYDPGDSFVNVTNGSKQMGTYLGEQGPFDVPDMILTNGVNHINITSKDSLGNKGDWKTCTVNASSSPLPNVFINGQPVDNNLYINNATSTGLMLQFPNSANLTSLILKYNAMETHINDAEKAYSAGGTYEGVLGLGADGYYKLNATAREVVSGQTVGPIRNQVYGFYLDTTPPNMTVNVVGASNGQVTTSNVNLQVVATDLLVNQIDFYVDGVPVASKSGFTKNQNINFMQTVYLGEDEGAKSLTVVATDMAGNSAPIDKALILNKPTQFLWMSPDSPTTSITPTITVNTPGEEENSCNITYQIQNGSTNTIPMDTELESHTATIPSSAPIIFANGAKKSSTLTVKCLDKFGSVQTSQPFVLMIDNDYPEITAFSLANGTLKANYPDFKNYSIVNPTTPNTIRINASEPVRCEYVKITHTGGVDVTEDPVEFTSTGYGLYAETPISYTAGLDHSYKVYCYDQSGLVSITKTLNAKIGGNASVYVYNPRPEGVVNSSSNVFLRVSTALRASCNVSYGGVANESMTPTSNGLNHTADASLVTLEHGKLYLFDVVCTDGSGNYLDPSAAQISFTTDFEGPAMDINCTNDTVYQVNSLLLTLSGHVIDAKDVGGDFSVQAKKGATVLKTATANGEFVLADMILNNGLNTLVISSKDAYGHPGNNQTCVFNVSSSGLPDVFLADQDVDNNLLLGTSSPELKLYFENDANITSFILRYPNGTSMHKTTYEQTYTGGQNTSLGNLQLAGDGNYQIGITAKEDVSGASSKTQWYGFAIDTIAPALNAHLIGTDSSGFIGNPYATLDIVASDAHMAEIDVIFGNDTVYSQTEFADSKNIKLDPQIYLGPDDGTKLIYVHAVDIFGKEKNIEVNVTLDKATEFTWIEPPFQRTKETYGVVITIETNENMNSCNLTFGSQNIGMTGTNIYYSATLNGLQSSATVDTVNPVSISCLDEFNRAQNRNYNITVDMNPPLIVNATFENVFKASEDNVTKYYMMTNISSPVTLRVDASEPVNCTYLLDISGTPGSTNIEMSEISANPTSPINVVNGQSYIVNLTCADVVGWQSAQIKLLRLDVNSNATVIITSHTPNYVNTLYPMLNVSTITAATCYAKLGAASEVKMNKTTNSLSHSLNVSYLNSGGLTQGTQYNFTITCSNNQSGITLGDGNLNLPVRPDITPPILKSGLNNLTVGTDGIYTVITSSASAWVSATDNLLGSMTLRIYNNGTEIYNQTINHGTTYPSINIPLAMGLNNITLRAYDGAQNPSNTINFKILSPGPQACIIIDGRVITCTSEFVDMYNILMHVPDHCLPPNNAIDWSETDLNCGGDCIGCVSTQRCLSNNDCLGGICVPETGRCK